MQIWVKNIDFACNRWQAPIMLELGVCFLGDWQGNDFMPHFTGQLFVDATVIQKPNVFIANQFPEHRIWKGLCSLPGFLQECDWQGGNLQRETVITDRKPGHIHFWLFTEIVLFLFGNGFINDLLNKTSIISILHKHQSEEARSEYTTALLSCYVHEYDYCIPLTTLGYFFDKTRYCL